MVRLSHNYNFGRALDQTTYTFYNQTMQSDYLYVGGETPVFNGMQNVNSIKKSKYEVLAAKEDLQYIRDDVALNVALAYLADPSEQGSGIGKSEPAEYNTCSRLKRQKGWLMPAA